MDRAGPVRLEILTGFKGGKRLAEVTIRALRKSYGGLQVIHGLDLDIPDGAFVVLVGLLVLITFVGEAVREAFDPKKFTYYR